jgi:hypothetical protein
MKTEKTDPQLFGHPRFYEILKDMADLHSRKNHDYAGTSDPLKNLRACTRIDLEPFMGVLVRLQDKWSRLEEFVKSGKLMVKNESVIDTLMDNAVYSILAIILYEEQLKGEKTDIQPFVVPEGWVVKLANFDNNNDCGWYIKNTKMEQLLWKDLTFNAGTGYFQFIKEHKRRPQFGEAPGYWPTEEAAKNTLQGYLEKTDVAR